VQHLFNHAEIYKELDKKYFFEADFASGGDKIKAKAIEYATNPVKVFEDHAKQLIKENISGTVN